MVSAILVLAFAILLVGPWHAQLGPSTVWFHISYQQSLQHVVFILIWFLSTASLKRQSKQVSMSFSWKTSHIQTFLVGRKLYIVFRRLLSSSFLHLQNRGQWHSALYSVLLLRVYDAIAHCDGMQVGTPLANHTSFSGLNRDMRSDRDQNVPTSPSSRLYQQTKANRGTSSSSSDEHSGEGQHYQPQPQQRTVPRPMSVRKVAWSLASNCLE